MRSLSCLRAAAPAVALALALAGVTLATEARAHAVVVDAKPKVGAEVTPADHAVILRYNSRIDHARSRLTLVPADGKPRLLAILPDSAPDIVSATLPDLSPGAYRLRWQVLAIDGHLTRGDIPFSVKAP